MRASNALHILGIIAGIGTVLMCLTDWYYVKYTLAVASLIAFAVSDLLTDMEKDSRNVE